MSIHQIIYTSCMRGINSVNDGQQVYSYDAGFQDAGNDEIKRLFTYQHPTLEAGVVMTEELALTMPASYIYRHLENGLCALALNTYLGRDYMGSAGRFGNHLSHVIVCDAAEMESYPAEYYGSGMLRSRMTFEEVNNPNKPDLLPSPKLERGFTANIDAVIEFLGTDDRMEIYKNMLYAMLSFSRERKRVVICDQLENIILWIAALTFALPLQNALQINFSTYDFDPSLSSSRICGVVPHGTKYNSDSQRQHFVFDLLSSQNAEFEKDPEFYDFIDTAMSFSYESLQDFHTFLRKGYSYDDADEELYKAYTLYSILSDGAASLTMEKLEAALSFAEKFALPEESVRIIQQLLEEGSTLIQMEDGIFLRVVQYIMSYTAELDSGMVSRTKELVVDRVLRQFLDEDVEEETFVHLYHQMNASCGQYGFSVATELMEYRSKLFAVMEQKIAAWKIAFIVRVVSDYVKDQHLPVEQLLPGAGTGEIYNSIVRAVYSRNRQNGTFIIEKILEMFSQDCVYLVNMALNLEGIVLDLPYGKQETDTLWHSFGRFMCSAQSAHFETAYGILNEYKRYDIIYLLYTLALEQASGTAECQKVFENHYHMFVRLNSVYAAEYQTKVLETYYDTLSGLRSPNTAAMRKALCYLLAKDKIDVPFAEELTETVTQPLPLAHPADTDIRLVRELLRYNYSFRQKPVSGKLLLLVIGITLEYAQEKDKKSRQKDMIQLQNLTKNNPADLTRVSEKSAEEYFDWLLPNVCELCGEAAELTDVYHFFSMSVDEETLFFTQCAKIYLKQNKKDYGAFCEFLSVLFENASVPAKKEVGKILCKLTKQKREALDKTVAQYFKDDKYAMQCWSEIRETTENTNVVLNSIASFFKRRKD